MVRVPPMARYMKRNNHKCGCHRVRRLMRLTLLVPICQEPNTSQKHPGHKIWPCLLRHVVIDRPNQVWCADITCIPMRHGFLYLVAIMDFLRTCFWGGLPNMMPVTLRLPLLRFRDLILERMITLPSARSRDLFSRKILPG